MTTKKPATRKKNSAKQRADTTLDKTTARALIEKVRTEGKIYDEWGKPVTIYIEGEPKKLSCYTVDHWLRRRNVIPETGETLRDLVDAAKEENRARKREKRQEEMIEMAEQGLKQILSLPVETRKTTRKFNKDKKSGKYSEQYKFVESGEDARMASVKEKGLTFALERLDPQRYSQKLQTDNRHMHFSLSDLRKAKQEQE